MEMRRQLGNLATSRADESRFDVVEAVETGFSWLQSCRLPIGFSAHAQRIRRPGYMNGACARIRRIDLTMGLHNAA
jgi:hypothetical protein